MTKFHVLFCNFNTTLLSIFEQHFHSLHRHRGTTGLCVFQVYIHPDLAAAVVYRGVGCYIECSRLINGATLDLMTALVEGWPLRNGTWDSKVLEMVTVNQYGCRSWSCPICRQK